MAKVDLDAIIRREDFEITGEGYNTGSKISAISVRDLDGDAFFYSSLRKPDFQRETNEWDASKIIELLESFLSGDLIPAIILWQSPSPNVFVIDGSHRISALKAWIDDDYGDGISSKKFYNGRIPEEQIKIAEAARIKINKKIGKYSDYKLSLTNPEKVAPNITERAKRLGTIAIPLQWVEGDANKAEKSFFKINQQPAPINPTELTLLKSRKKPNCIAARAIIRSGSGHKYWSAFTKVKQEEIETLAKEINMILFAPPLNTPVKTLDVPIGGKLYSAQALPLILDFINLVNDTASETAMKLDDDTTGDETIKYLKKARKVAWRINGQHASSLGLHPIIYFYSREGRHKQASFSATVSFVMELENASKLKDFTDVRPSFEKFLLKYDYLIQQLFRFHRSAYKATPHIRDFYLAMIGELKNGNDSDTAVEKLLKTPKYNKVLTLQTDVTQTTSPEFNSERKSAVFIKDAIDSAVKCKICGGNLHINSITIDHIDRKQDGGVGSIENGQVAHPYCNSTYKN